MLEPGVRASIGTSPPVPRPTDRPGGAPVADLAGTVPRPAGTVPRPARAVAPRPARAVAPRPAGTVAPRPAGTVAHAVAASGRLAATTGRLAGTVARLVGRWRWPLAATVVSVGATLAWSMLLPWSDRAGHVTLSSWQVPGDIWATVRAAHTIVWGDLGGIYQAGTGLVSLPGAALLLVPVAVVDQVAHLSESFPFTLPHPTAWWVLGPYEVIISCSVLFTIDALARRLGVPAGRRVALVWAEAAVLFPVDALWGHPEDAVAVALLVLAAVRLLDGRPVAAGWLVGAAVAVQPLVLLGVPVLVGAQGWRRAVPFLVRSAVPAMLVVGIPLVAAPGATLHALVDQPNFPHIDHPTPWTALAPVLGGHGMGLAVAAGPGRLVALALAAATAPLAWRWRHRRLGLAWLLAVALALRVVTESVLDPYYLWPALALALVVAAAAGPGALAATAVLTSAGSAMVELPMPWLVWWAVAVVTVVGAVGLAPAVVAVRRRRAVADPPDEVAWRAARAGVHSWSGAVAAEGSSVQGSSSRGFVPLAPPRRDRRPDPRSAAPASSGLRGATDGVGAGLLAPRPGGRGAGRRGDSACRRS